MLELDAKHLNRVLTDLMKTIKVVSVYPDNNPIPIKLKESFIDRFSDIIRENGILKFKVDENRLLLNNEIVYEDSNPEESLASLFHFSGITKISFSDRFGTEEANLFFRALKSYINKAAHYADLALGKSWRK